MRFSNGPLRIYGHRGAPVDRPENTLDSFQFAIECGATALELDVRRTADERIVAIHDKSGARTCGRRRLIKDTNLAELADWDAGFGYVDSNGDRPFFRRGLRVPLLSEVLGTFKTIPINVDIKDTGTRTARLTASVVAQAPSSERITISSADHGILTELRNSGYAGPLGMGQQQAIKMLLLPVCASKLLGGFYQSAQIPFVYRGIRFDRPWIVERAHKLGMRVDYWTINSPDRAQRVLEIGADGFMTDDPRSIAVATTGLV